MTRTLYVLGVGPGDPELLTLKAIRIIMEVGCLCVPKVKRKGVVWPSLLSVKRLISRGPLPHAENSQRK